MEAGSKWGRIALFNLLIVASLGTLMRYKIAFEFPYLEQKFIQHAHSHFAFSGWISFLLMVLMIRSSESTRGKDESSSYNRTLYSSLISSYGMLVSFLVQGYGPVSIFFSSASMLVTLWFGIRFIGSMRQRDTQPSDKWFVFALICYLVSAGGTAVLSIMMSTGHFEQHLYLAALYWYLHFQYNGWFFFALGGIGIHFLFERGILLKGESMVFKGFAWSCVPAYGLSVLWAGLSWPLYTVVVIGSVLQFLAWLYFLKIGWTNRLVLSRQVDLVPRVLFLFTMLAFTIKLALQLGSVIPSLSHLAFGFRPIVIAYLHLVLLAFTTVQLLGYLHLTGLVRFQGMALKGLVIFLLGIFLNQSVLAIQGIASFSYVIVPNVNEILFGIAVLMFFGLLVMQKAEG